MMGDESFKNERMVEMQLTKVTLATNDLEKMKTFYADVLEAPLLDESSHSFSIKIGASELMFNEIDSERRPIYHFAFNIPSNQFQEAKRWIQSRQPLNVEDGKDEVYFQNIDAHSLYFNDPSGNIVEFIARHASGNERTDAFSMNSLISIGEINLTTKETEAIGRQLIEFGIHPVSDIHSDGLTFMGSGDAFLLLGKPGRRWYFSDKLAESHLIRIEIDSTCTIYQDEKNIIRFIHAK